MEVPWGKNNRVGLRDKFKGNVIAAMNLGYVLNKDTIDKWKKIINNNGTLCINQVPIVNAILRIFGKMELCDYDDFLPCNFETNKCLCSSIIYGERLMNDNIFDKLRKSRIEGREKFEKDGLEWTTHELLNANKIAISHSWMSTSIDSSAVDDTLYALARNNLNGWVDLLDLNGKWTDQYTADIYGDCVIICEPTISKRKEGLKDNWQALLLSPWALRGWTSVELMVAGKLFIYTRNNDAEFNIISLEEWLGEDGVNKLLDKRLLYAGIIGVSLKMIKDKHGDGEFASVIPCTKNNEGFANEHDIAWLVSILSSRIWTIKKDLPKALTQLTGIKDNYINLLNKASNYAGLWLTTRSCSENTGDGFIPINTPRSGLRWPEEEVSFLLKKPKLYDDGDFVFYAKHMLDFYNEDDYSWDIGILTEYKSMTIKFYETRQRKLFSKLRLLGIGEINVFNYENFDEESLELYKESPKTCKFIVLNCKHELNSDDNCHKCLTRGFLIVKNKKIKLSAVVEFYKPIWFSDTMFILS